MLNREELDKVIAEIRKRYLKRVASRQKSESVNESAYFEEIFQENTESPLDFTPESSTITVQKNTEPYLEDDDLTADSDDYVWVCTNPQYAKDGGPGSGNHGHGGRKGQRGGSTPGGGTQAKGRWPDDFPKVMIHTTTAKMKSHPSYSGAKHGDYDDARTLVDDLCKGDRMKQLADSYPDAIVVPVMSAGSGHNLIPVAYADKLGEHGMKVSKDIKIVEKANHTEKTQMERLASQNKFEGKVELGRTYVIVDDVVTNGGSVNGLRQYIEKNGGKVVAASTLTAGKGSTQIAPTQKTIDAVNAKHGKERVNSFLKSAGVEGGLRSLTNREANFVRSMNPSALDEYIKGGL